MRQQCVDLAARAVEGDDEVVGVVAHLNLPPSVTERRQKPGFTHGAQALFLDPLRCFDVHQSFSLC
jgi:hypothetical protein